MLSTLFRRLCFAAALLAAPFATPTASADIVVGQISPMTGVLANTGQQIVLGAKIWFDHVNANGGINGQKIKHVVMNDTFKIPETIANTKTLIEKEKPAALIGYLGTVTLAEIIKDGVLQKNSMPLVAPYSGSLELRDPPYPWFFHIRASYADETAYMADHLATLGMKRVAILYQDDSFGYAGLKGFEAAAAKHGIEIIAKGSYQLAKPELANAVKTIAAANPQAVIMAATTTAAGLFAKSYREIGGNGLLLNVSVLDTALLIKNAGLDAVRGMGITQIVPYPFSGVSPLVKDFRRDFAKYAPKDAAVTYAVFETYIGARVLTEALKRAGNNPSSAKVAQALQNLGKIDLGGFTVEFNKANVGSRFVEVVVIGAEGRLLK